MILSDFLAVPFQGIVDWTATCLLEKSQKHATSKSCTRYGVTVSSYFLVNILSAETGWSKFLPLGFVVSSDYCLVVFCPPTALVRGSQPR